MEKYGVGGDELTLALRNEEAELMQKMAGLMSRHTKTAAEEAEAQRVQARLQEVRGKLTEIDLKNRPTFG
jgi:hypothetical protein